MVQFLLEVLLKQIILVAYHDFHWLLVAAKLLTVKLRSRYIKGSESGVGDGVGNFGKVGVGDFTSDSTTLATTTPLNSHDVEINFVPLTDSAVKVIQRCREMSRSHQQTDFVLMN